MISESQQEQATLHALELLDADEAAAFERQIEADSELRELVRDLRETAALLALASGGNAVQAPPALRARILADASADGRPAGRAIPARTAWLPWAIAALFMGCSGVLGGAYVQQQKHGQAIARRNAADASVLVDPARLSFCALEPTPAFTAAQPHAAVLWDAKHQQGKLRVNRLAPPAEGKDYQLWTVEADRKEPASAGVVHLDAEGRADVPFRSVSVDGKPVVAVAISLEQAGGSPTNQGPILLLGKF